MARLDLTEQETQILVEILESSRSDLATETAATENRELRAVLKEKKKFIGELLARLKARP